jgi:prepilin-type N-terminal cleavage/methylation domain-containing protein
MNRRGMTLVELLVTLVIAGIAFSTIVIPFATERAFWKVGERKAEAQQSAEVVLRAMGRHGRHASQFAITTIGPQTILTFTPISGSAMIFRGGPAFNGGQLIMQDISNSGVLIDGVRTKVTNYTVTTLIPNRLVRVRLEVQHVADANRKEVMETEIHLRNG